MDAESEDEALPCTVTATDLHRFMVDESEEDCRPLEMAQTEHMDVDLCPNLSGNDLFATLDQEPNQSEHSHQELNPEAGPSCSGGLKRRPAGLSEIDATAHLPTPDVSCLPLDLAESLSVPAHKHSKVTILQDEKLHHDCPEVLFATDLVSVQSPQPEICPDEEAADPPIQTSEVSVFGANDEDWFEDYLDADSDGEPAAPPYLNPFLPIESDEDIEEESDNEQMPDIDPSKEVPLYEGASINVGESLVAILSFMSCEQLSKIGLKRLLNLINLFLPQPNNFFKSHKRFLKLIEDLDEPVTFHYFCSSCHRILKSSKDLCEKCSNEDRSVLFFMTFSLASQLSKLFKRPEFVINLQFKNSRIRQSADNIEDLYDGEVYKKIQQERPSLPYDITLTWNTDGIQIFKSNTYSLWPFYLVVNELPPEQRFLSENLLVAGLWGNLSKPHSFPFLLPIYKDIQTLKEGIDLEVHGEDMPQKVRVLVTCGTCDAPARATFMNMKMYSGFYSCPICEIRGEVSDVVVFPFKENVPLRDMVRYEEQKKHAVDNKVILLKKLTPRLEEICCGIKGPTLLSDIVHDMFECMGTDSMHCIYLGVTRALIELWFDKDHKDEPFSVHSQIKLVSQRLKCQQPPHFLQRQPQSLEKLVHWKATELRSFLFNLSLIVLKDVLKPEYYNHLALFVQGVALLNSNSVSQNDKNLATVLLSQFVEQFSLLYGERYMSHNLHMLLHLARAVQLLGPLWVFSCFKFEDINGRLKNVIHGTRHVSQQIHSNLAIVTGLPLMVKGLREGSVKEYCNDLVHKRHRLKVSEKISKGLYCVGDFQHVNEENSWILDRLENVNIITRSTSNVKVFFRLLRNNVQIHSSAYSKGLRVSSYVKYKNDTEFYYGKIECFVRVGCSTPTLFLALISPVSVVPFKVDFVNVNHLKIVSETQNLLHLVSVHDLETVLFKVECDGLITLSEPLNKFEME